MIRNLISLFMVVFWISVVTFLFLYWADGDLRFLHQDISSKPEMHHIQALNDASLIILTFIIACIAWFQLSGIFKINQADFLLRIDERLGNSNIIEARKIIHRLYKESRTINPHFTEPQHCHYMANKIYELGENKDPEDSQSTDDYVSLLNFMDFLETVSLFANKNYISINEVDDLMNQSLEFFYSIFSKRIQERRRKYNDDSFYEQFELVHKKIQCSKNRVSCICIRCWLNCH